MSIWTSPFFFPHAVKIADVVAAGGMGSTAGTARDSVAEVTDEQRLVRSADGEEVVSSTQVTVPLEPPVAHGALVTVWPGTSRERTATVLVVETIYDDPPLPSFQVLSLE